MHSRFQTVPLLVKSLQEGSGQPCGQDGRVIGETGNREVSLLEPAGCATRTQRRSPGLGETSLLLSDRQGWKTL